MLAEKDIHAWLRFLRLMSKTTGDSMFSLIHESYYPSNADKQRLLLLGASQ